MSKPICKLCGATHWLREGCPPGAVSLALEHLRAQGFARPAPEVPVTETTLVPVTVSPPTVTSKRDRNGPTVTVVPSVTQSVTPEEQARETNRERQRRYRERRGGDGT